MPGQQIAQANPPPDASLLPDSLLDFGVQLDNKDVLSKHELAAIHKFRRAADYIAAGEHSGNELEELQPRAECSTISHDFPEIERPS